MCPGYNCVLPYVVTDRPNAWSGTPMPRFRGYQIVLCGVKDESTLYTSELIEAAGQTLEPVTGCSVCCTHSYNPNCGQNAAFLWWGDFQGCFSGSAINDRGAAYSVGILRNLSITYNQGV